MIIAIDFDGVLHDYKHPVEGRRLGPPMPGAAEAVMDLQDAGHKLIIHSCKASTPGGVEMIQGWLTFYDIDILDIAVSKPMADIYLDDKALPFADWSTTLEFLGVGTDDN